MKDTILKDNKFLIQNGTFVFTKTKIEYVLQKAKEILQTVVGEDLQDISKGLDLQGVMFNEQVSTSDIYSEILRNLNSIPEIQEVLSISINQKKEKLLINIQFIVDNITEEVSINV